MKRMLALLMALTMTFAQAACSGDNGQSSQEPSAPVSEAPASQAPSEPTQE